MTYVMIPYQSSLGGGDVPDSDDETLHPALGGSSGVLSLAQ